MTIEWIEAESAIDDRQALLARREKLETEYLANPTDADAALRLLSVLDQLGVPAPDMTAMVEPAMQANPNDASLMAWLGQLSYRLGEMKLAMLTLKHAVTLDPGETLANFTLAQLMLYTGVFKDALGYAERAWATGQAVHYAQDIGRAYCISLARLKRFDEALKFQQERLTERPDDAQANIDTADLLREMQRDAEAETLLLDAHKRRPSDTELLMRIAVMYFEDERLDAALAWADKLLAADAQHLEGWNLRSQVRFKLGDYTGAISDHEMILELGKTMPLDRGFMADCLVALGRKDEAIAGLKTGLKEVKNWPQRRQQYEQHLEKLQVQPPAAQRKGPKLGPNDPCWCGSGKKLKKCHGG